MIGEKAGALALVGSGEYLEAMNETDLNLLATLGGPEQARVVLIPTASGLEAGMPRYWSDLGLAHFGRLGAKVEEVWLVERAHAADPAILDVLSQANFFYFSGGNPVYLTETLQDTPAWEIISKAHLRGAVLAGCSAGAMAFGGYTLSVRAMMQGQPPQWVAALGMLPGVATIPHFDRMANFITPELFKAVVASAPVGVTLLGVDEDTALVLLPDGGWQVMGRQSVSVFDRGGERLVYQPSQSVPLSL